MKQIKIAFAGFRHGHIFALYDLVKQREDVSIVGVWEEDFDTINILKSKGIEVSYKTYSELLNDPNVDAVAIGNYYAARGQMTIDALKMGKSVIADKPICTNIAELDEIEKLQKEKNLAVGMMLDLRSCTSFYTALQAVKNNVIGKINNINFNGQHPLLYGSRPQWYFEKEKYGGVICDIAIHGIDLVRLFTDSNISEVVGARCWNFYADKEPDFKDSAQFILKTESGVGVMADVSYATPATFAYVLPSYWSFNIWGEKGLIECSATSNDVILYLNGENQPRKLENIESPVNYFDEFVAAVLDMNVAQDYSREMLASMKQSLIVQQKAI